MIDLIPLAPENDSLERIRADIGDCKRCRLCEGRNQIVFGSGNERASLVFVGEGPGADEDASGEPFVGEAGELLNSAIVKGLKLTRDDVYICNVVKCHPPDNRTPQIDEINERYVKGLKFYYVTEMKEVLEIALLKEKVKNAKTIN